MTAVHQQCLYLFITSAFRAPHQAQETANLCVDHFTGLIEPY